MHFTQFEYSKNPLDLGKPTLMNTPHPLVETNLGFITYDGIIGIDFTEIKEPLFLRLFVQYGTPKN